MGKKKLQLDAWGVGGAADNNSGYLTLYFSRKLTDLEAAGIVYIVKERLTNAR